MPHTRHHFVDVAAFGFGFEGNLHPAAVERRIHPVAADKRSDIVHRRIFHQLIGQLLLHLHHRLIGNTLRRLGNHLQSTGILQRKKTFGHCDIQQHGQHHGRQRNQQRSPLVFQYPGKHACISIGEFVEKLAGNPIKTALFLLRQVFEQARAHHRRECERHHRRNQYRHRQGNRKFAEQAPDDIAHKQQRNQHGNQRERERDNGKPDLLGALERRLHRRFSLFQIALDVFNHHDRIVHHKTGGNGQRHQAQVIQRKTQQIHHGKGADQRNRHRYRRDKSRAPVAQKQENHHHDQAHRQHHLELHIVNRSADGLGTVAQYRYVYRGRQGIFQLGQ